MSESDSPTRAINPWIATIGLLLGALGALLALRVVLDTGALPVRWDEKYVLPIIDRIFSAHWSIAALLDYDDTKGPIFFWLYAAFGEVFGRDLAALRLLSIVATALWIAALGLMLGARERTAFNLAAVGALALTLPYGAVLSQLVMSEATFLLGSAVMAVCAVRALSSDDDRTRLVFGPIVFAILFALLLHHRIHVVALAGAVVCCALLRDGWRSWPWFVAGLAAGLCRLPLYLRWGGLVGESFQHRYSVGVRADSLVYLGAALLPTIGFVLVAGFMRRRELGSRGLGAILIAGGFGAGLAAIAPPAISSDPQALNFAGPVASVLRRFADMPILLNGALATLCALGVMSLTTLGMLNWSDGRDQTPLMRHSSRIAWLTITLGWLLSAAASGDVYDRYLIAFTFLWPLLCVRLFPRPLLVVQVLWQSALTAQQVAASLR